MKHIPTTETKFIRQFSLGSRKIKRPLTPPPTRDSTIILEELLWPERVGLPFLKARKHANRSGGRASEASACSRPPLSLSLSRTHREVLLADAAHREAVVAGVHGAGQYLVQVHGGVPVPQQTPQSAHTRARTPPCAFPLGAAAAEDRRLCRAPEAANARSGPAAHPEQGSRGLKGAGRAGGGGKRGRRRAAGTCHGRPGEARSPLTDPPQPGAPRGAALSARNARAGSAALAAQEAPRHELFPPDQRRLHGRAPAALASCHRSRRGSSLCAKVSRDFPLRSRGPYCTRQRLL